MIRYDTDAAIAFFDFVQSRHQAWEKRQLGLPAPWAEDPIVRTRRFTNVFRVLDYGSQFLVERLLSPYDDPRDVLMRCFLYRHTNLPSAWEAFAGEVGRYPLIRDLEDLGGFWKSYRAGGERVFSGAYMIYPQSATPGTDKIDSIIDLTKRLFLGERIDLDFFMSSSQAERFAVLRRNKGVADFMSMQILTDWGYSYHCGIDRENEFVVPGPGARKGAAELAPSAKAEDVIVWARDAILKLGDQCPKLPNGRVPSLMDVQNCLCEFSKYARYARKPLPLKEFQPTHPGPQPEPVLPAHFRSSE